MRISILIVLISLSSQVFAQSANYIICGNAKDAQYDLEIEVDKFQTLPAQSLVKLYYKGELVGQERALKNVKFFDTLPPQTAYSFNFIEDEEFEFLQVNLSKKSASMTPGYVNSEGKKIEITFQECESDNI